MAAPPLKPFRPLTMARSLWEYRHFVFNMVRREFRARYLGSLFGVVWALLNPLATILIYLVVFSAVMRGRLAAAGDPLSYGLFLCTGILLWGSFAEVVTRCQTVFFEHSNLIKKLAFPRITLPVIVLLTALVNLAIVAGVFLALLAALGRFPGAILAAALPLLAVQQGLALGLGILVGTLNVFFRDIGQFVSVFLNFWFWATPIVYESAILPAWAREAQRWNPLTELFLGAQGIVVRGAAPDWRALGWPLAVALAALLVGLVVFRRLSGQLVDEL